MNSNFQQNSKKNYFPLYLHSGICDSFNSDEITTLLKKKLHLENGIFETHSYYEEEKISVPIIGQILNTVSFAISPNNYRLFILKWHDTLTKHGTYNKLLKVFEEPPKGNIFLLFSHGFKLPPTILSRGIEINLFSKATKLQFNNSDGHFLNFIENNETMANSPLKNDLINYLLGEQKLSDFQLSLKKDKQAAEDLLLCSINFLLGKNLNCQKYHILSKIIKKYNSSRDLNLNRFDNILIPLKFMVDEFLPNK